MGRKVKSEPPEKQQSFTGIAVAVLGVIGTVIVAYLQYFGPTQLSIRTTQTAEAKQALIISSWTPTLNATSTLLPTLTFTPTFTPTETPIPIPGDFEVEADAKSWGNTPDIDNVNIGEGVTQDCENGYESKCSLMYQPTIEDNIIAKDNYVARYTSNKDNKSLIRIFVYVPKDVDLCLPNSGGCSTARVIVWDRNGKPHEGEIMKLTDKGQWREITLDLRGTTYPEPYRAVGVHFYLATQTIYIGPFHIDTVTTRF